MAGNLRGFREWKWAKRTYHALPQTLHDFHQKPTTGERPNDSATSVDLKDFSSDSPKNLAERMRRQERVRPRDIQFSATECIFGHPEVIPQRDIEFEVRAIDPADINRSSGTDYFYFYSVRSASIGSSVAARWAGK